MKRKLNLYYRTKKKGTGRKASFLPSFFFFLHLMLDVHWAK